MLISSENPAKMASRKINVEMSQLISALAADPHGGAVPAISARINMLQIELSAKNAYFWSRSAMAIAVVSLLVTLGFSVANYLSDKKWQADELKSLVGIEKNISHTIK